MNPSTTYRPAVPIIGLRCHYCDNFFKRSDIFHIGESIQMCHKCHEKHMAAIEALGSAKPPKECAECNRTWEELCALEKSERVPMFFHTDAAGIGFLICKECDWKYIQGHKEMYRPTRFGWEEKI